MRSNWKPNHHKMRDLMATAMVANEQEMKNSQDNQIDYSWLFDQFEKMEENVNDTEYSDYFHQMIERENNVGNAPNTSERTHVGNKTPVLGSMDLVTGN